MDNLGSSGHNTVEYSNVNFVKVGSIQYEKAGCAHIPYPSEYWDGVFGLNGLASFNIEINYDYCKIYCYDREPLTADGYYVSLDFIYKYDVLFIYLPVRLKAYCIIFFLKWIQVPTA